MQSVKTLDRVLRAALVLLLVAFVFVVGSAVYQKPIHVVVPGEQAPAFRVTTDDGRGISMPGFGAKLMVLNFWATWCPPCVEETPSMSQFAKDYAGRGVVVLAISVDTNEAAYRAFLDKYKPGFLTVRESTIHRSYGTFMYPESYIIDSSGKVVLKIPDRADWSSPNLRSYIDSLL
ncbi:MAG TPA: TlpA disulfide reductase family protein [Bryobacteraceae bacterium]|nr:TlpA disulfide reductase family protein [Bryobacteraceae bacterium]